VLSSTFIYLQHFSKRAEIRFATYKISVTSLRNARFIADGAPDGVMLAPRRLSGIIPMLKSSSPQIISSPLVRGYWIDYQEGVKRENATIFAEEGILQYKQDFEYVVSEGFVDVVVCQSNIFQAPSGKEILAILNNNGFIHKQTVKKLVIFWR
jgi:hypothetical protein